MSKTSLKKNAILNVIKTLMGIIFPIITFPYASRILMPEGIGKVNFANSIISYFALLASLGIETYATREAAKIREHIPVLRKLIKEILFINISSTIFAYALFFLSLFHIPKLYDYKTLLLICSLTILFNTIGINWFYTAMEDYAYITTRSIFFQLVNIAFLFIFVKTKEDIYLYAFLNVIASAGSSILNLIHLRKFISLRETDTLEIKKHIKPIFLLFGMSVITSIYTILDSTMLGFLSNDAQVGFYSAATKINKMVLTVVVSIGGVLFPRLSFYSEKENKSEFYELLTKGFLITLCIAIPCTFGLHVLSLPITLLFSGENYLPAVPIMKIMNPIIILISISNFIGIQCFLTLKKEKLTIYTVILGAVTNFTLNIILIPKFQALGAGIATVCAEASVTLFQLILARKEINYKKIAVHFIEFLAAAIIMSVAVIILVRSTQNIIYQLIISVPCGAAIYFTILLLLKNKILLSIITSIKKRFNK